jgi:hypothetical protein
LQDDQKFENKYLDPSLGKEKKKVNTYENNRLMKLNLTDGLNIFDAIEY